MEDEYIAQQNLDKHKACPSLDFDLNRNFPEWKVNDYSPICINSRIFSRRTLEEGYNGSSERMSSAMKRAELTGGGSTSVGGDDGSNMDLSSGSALGCFNLASKACIVTLLGGYPGSKNA